MTGKSWRVNPGVDCSAWTARVKCGWTPYDGMKIKGWPIMTVIRGNIVMREDELSGPIGQPMLFNR